MLNKQSFLKERAIDNLLAAKKHSDHRQYKYKHEILALMLSKSPEDFYIDSDDGGIVGITHSPTKFKIHIPKKLVPSKIEKKIMPASSQKQQKLMNWVHAIQKGKAQGPEKVNNIANNMKPISVEHFMGRGHINKELPVKKAFELGFLNRANEIGLSVKQATALFKLALEQPPAPFGEGGAFGSPAPAPKMDVDISKPLPGTALNGPSGQNFPQLSSTPQPQDPNAHNSLNTGASTPNPLPQPSPGVGSTPPPPTGMPGGPPPPASAPSPASNEPQPGSYEHAQQMYLNNNDDSGLRAWTQAHPSPALQAARAAEAAWKNVGKLVDDDIAGHTNIQQTGEQLDSRLQGVNPFMVGSTVMNSTEGNNYNNAWAGQMDRQKLTGQALNKAISANKQYDIAYKLQQRRNNLYTPPPTQLLGGNSAPEALNGGKPISFKVPTIAGVTASRG